MQKLGSEEADIVDQVVVAAKEKAEGLETKYEKAEATGRRSFFSATSDN